MAGKGKRFEDLDVYQKARELTQEIYEITRRNAFSRDFGLVDQIRRAAVSIMSNIGEGYERGTDGELIQFLSTAKASCAEVGVQIQVALDQKYIDQSDYLDLYEKCVVIGKMSGSFIRYLKESKEQNKKPRASEGASR